MNIRSGWVGLFTAAALVGAPAFAQDYPTDAVKIVVGSSPGGSTDAMARIIANGLSEKWGKAVVVENREGAMNTIAAEYVANANKDGLTLLMASPQHTQAPAQMELKFDAVTGFAPITMVDKYPTYLVVNSEVPVEDAASFIKYVKDHPGELNYGSAGRGSGQYRNMAILMKEAGLEMNEITYSGGSPANLALMGNEVQATFSSLGGVRSMDEGKVKVLAVTTASPSPFLPEVPPLQTAAAVPGFDEFDWHALFAPAGTPPEVVEKIHADVTALFADPKYKEMADGLGVELVLNSPAEFSQFVEADVTKWKDFFAAVPK